MSDFLVRKHSELCRLIVRHGISERIYSCCSIRMRHPMHLVAACMRFIWPICRMHVSQLKLIVNSVRTVRYVFAFEHLEFVHHSLFVFHIALFCHIRLRNYFLPAKSFSPEKHKRPFSNSFFFFLCVYIFLIFFVAVAKIKFNLKVSQWPRVCTRALLHHRNQIAFGSTD